MAVSELLALCLSATDLIADRQHSSRSFAKHFGESLVREYYFLGVQDLSVDSKGTLFICGYMHETLSAHISDAKQNGHRVRE